MSKPRTPSQRPRVLLLANHQKQDVNDALRTLRPWLSRRARIVAEHDSREMSPRIAAELPPVDLAIVLGGDGTLLAQARALAGRHVPLLGVNFGKLGFMAEFSLEELRKFWPQIAAGKCRTTRRIMLDVSVGVGGGNGRRKNGSRLLRKDAAVTAGLAAGAGDTSDSTDASAEVFSCLAVNDAVITAGPPFRMIDLELVIDPDDDNAFITRFTADGVIVSTPSGSTAYNLAAGGPIVSPQVGAVCITPLCPHSLSFRPIITRAEADTRVRLMRGNDGTTLVIDGQRSTPLREGQEVRVRLSDKYLELVHNPTFSYWKLLATKLRWAARPRRG